MRTLELHELQRSFRGVDALRGISLTIQAGENVALLGPSGSGKSTLLRIIAGLDTPDTGDVLLDGESQLARSAHQRDVAMVFQQYALYPHLTVLRNITTGLRHGKGLSRAEALTRADDVLRLLEIDQLRNRYPREMSGGQRQRVAVARALARQTGVVLLDEPLSGLDAQLRLVLRSEISSRLRETGATVVHVTHDQTDALATADRIAVIDKGCLRQVGTPEELYREPADVFVAQFIGTPPIAILPLEPVGNGLWRSLFGEHEGLEDAESAWIGVRPEALQMSDTLPWTGSARVANTELAGADHVVYLTAEGHLLTTRTGSGAPTPGSTVPVSCAPEDVLVFAGPQQQRIGDGRLLPLRTLERTGTR